MKDSVPLRNYFSELEDLLGPVEFSKETSYKAAEDLQKPQKEDSQRALFGATSSGNKRSHSASSSHSDSEDSNNTASPLQLVMGLILGMARDRLEIGLF